ncbi:Prostaglandin E synthase 2 [Amphibalanus amphitrite]|uniref:Prostaglandin E synthase 2 n=1 Tax=Amphibalanus amphitrite TaxID=1232801 RepID=A0A6A4UYI7_AMPAM|nr:Prostaglandin E synthase 2 [Amphibalanus amphitrite]
MPSFHQALHGPIPRRRRGTLLRRTTGRSAPGAAGRTTCWCTRCPRTCTGRPSEALQAFRWFSETGDWERLFSNWERLLVIYVGAAAMYGIGKILKRRHNLKSDVRESLYEACDTWTRELRHRGTPFLGGERPNVADVSVYGVLSSIGEKRGSAGARTRLAPGVVNTATGGQSLSGYTGCVGSR